MPKDTATRTLKALQKASLSLVPVHLRTTGNEIGLDVLFATGWHILGSYAGTTAYMVRRQGITAALNYVYSKVLVPGGEGTPGLLFPIIGPFIRKRQSLTWYPTAIEVETTTVCNKRCIHCEHTHWSERSRHLSFEEFTYITNQFPNLKWTNLTGEGSSFLNRDYLKMLKHMKERKVQVAVVDHFDDLNDEIADGMIRYGIDHVCVSIDGASTEVYNAIKVGCDFERVVRNIDRFAALKKKMNARIPAVVFRYVITTMNQAEMPRMIGLIASLPHRKYLGPGSYVEFTGLLEFDQNQHLKVRALPEEIMRETLARAREHKVVVVFSHSEESKLPPSHKCLAWLEPYVMMGGDVVQCCAVLMSNKRPFLRGHAFGNVYERAFSEIWHSERYRRFRSQVNQAQGKVPLMCSGCRSFNVSDRIEKYGIAEDL